MAKAGISKSKSNRAIKGPGIPKIPSVRIVDNKLKKLPGVSPYPKDFATIKGTQA